MARIDLEDHPDATPTRRPSSAKVHEEYDLPGVEAMLACTLALMTGYSQSLQAAQHPEQRVLMGSKIGRHMGLLADHPQLSEAFRQVAQGLQQRWVLMTACTVESEPMSTGSRSQFH